MNEPCRLILASASRARRDMLAAAGVVIEIMPANVDEEKIRAALATREADNGPARVAEELAVAKSDCVSANHPDAIVIGADQILALGAQIFAKPADRGEARATLETLSGKTHHLYSAVAVSCNGKTQWTHVESAKLTMRTLSEPFLDHYLETAGSGILNCVGAYELEGLGAQLFSSVKGDYFTVLGLPLIATLQHLRERGCLLT